MNAHAGCTIKVLGFCLRSLQRLLFATDYVLLCLVSQYKIVALMQFTSYTDLGPTVATWGR